MAEDEGEVAAAALPGSAAVAVEAEAEAVVATAALPDRAAADVGGDDDVSLPARTATSRACLARSA